MGGEIALVVGLAGAEEAEGVVAELGEGGAAAGEDAVPALEAQGKADVHELDHVAVTAHLALHLFEDVEEALAAGDLVVEEAGEALAGPGAVAAPGGAEDQVVDGGAQRVAGGAEGAGVHAGLEGLLLEGADGVHHGAAEAVGVRVLGAAAEADDGGEHGGGGADEGVDADEGEDVVVIPGEALGEGVVCRVACCGCGA